MKMRSWLAAPFAAVLLVALTPTAADAAPLRIRLDATATCPRTGGIDVGFTIANRGPHEQRLNGDFHLFLDAVRSTGRKPVGALFVFPAPGFDTIPGGEQRTFLLSFGTAMPEAGEPGLDLSAHRLLLEAEVFLVGWDGKIHRTFSFPGCAPPS